jgi:hypothetical protein
MKAWTDYPFVELGDVPWGKAPVRECTVLSYDQNRYCRILIDGHHLQVKIGYVYRKPGRCGEVRSINKWKTRRSDGVPYWKTHKRRIKKTSWIVRTSNDWTEFDTKREAIKKFMSSPLHSTLLHDGYTNGNVWTRALYERVDPQPYRMKRRYAPKNRA